MSGWTFIKNPRFRDYHHGKLSCQWRRPPIACPDAMRGLGDWILPQVLLARTWYWKPDCIHKPSVWFDAVEPPKPRTMVYRTDRITVSPRRWCRLEDFTSWDMEAMWAVIGNNKWPQKTVWFEVTS